MPGYATIDNLRDRYAGTITTDQQTYAETLLDDAFDVIVEEVPAIPDRLDANETGLLNKIIRIQCAMVGRVLQNPNGYLTESVDEYTYRYDSAVSAGRLYLADDELGSLTPARGRGKSFSIRPA
jgi:hypothetical protein